MAAGTDLKQGLTTSDELRRAVSQQEAQPGHTNCKPDGPQAIGSYLRLMKTECWLRMNSLYITLT